METKNRIEVYELWQVMFMEKLTVDIESLKEVSFWNTNGN